MHRGLQRGPLESLAKNWSEPVWGGGVGSTWKEVGGTFLGAHTGLGICYVLSDQSGKTS